MFQTIPSEFPDMANCKLVVIAVCTYKRPKMLETCLASLAGQELPPDVMMQIAVIDNDDLGSAHQTYVRFQRFCAFPTQYLQQPKRGIAAARNKAIDFALERNADYLAFIDDDEIAHKGWAAALMHPDFEGVPIIGGQQVMVYGDDIPLWAKPRKPKSRPENGAELKFAYTNNVRYSADVLKSGVRFNERIGLGGGSDHEFCADAKAKGFYCRYAARAITWETAHPERYTIEELARRTHRCEITKIMYFMKTKGKARTIAGSAVAIILAGPAVAFYFLLGCIASPFSEHRSKRAFLHSAKKLAKAVGRWHGMAGYVPQVYAKTAGE